LAGRTPAGELDSPVTTPPRETVQMITKTKKRREKQTRILYNLHRVMHRQILWTFDFLHMYCSNSCYAFDFSTLHGTMPSERVARIRENSGK
jgi:hypothetical protein